MSQMEGNFTIDMKMATKLEDLGFSSNESRIYLSTLYLGKGTVSQITKSVGINRTTGYDVLNNLAIKGLVSVLGKEPKQEYVAESPNKVIEYLQSRLKSQEMRLKDAKELILELKSVHKVGDRPTVKFYEGKQGMVTVYEDTLTSSETILGYASVDDMHTTLPDYFPKYYKRRTDKGIKIRAILPDTEAGRERASKDKYEARDTALINSKKYGFTPEINIYDNKVIIVSLKEELGVIIESQEVADAMKKLYELAWLEAKRQDADIRKKK